MKPEAYTLKIIYGGNGYSIYCEDGRTPMEFLDGAKTNGFGNDLKAAIKVCTDHGYKFEY